MKNTCRGLYTYAIKFKVLRETGRVRLLNIFAEWPLNQTGKPVVLNSPRPRPTFTIKLKKKTPRKCTVVPPQTDNILIEELLPKHDFSLACHVSASWPGRNMLHRCTRCHGPRFGSAGLIYIN